MTEERKGALDNPEVEAANQLARLIERKFPDQLKDPSFSAFLQQLEEKLAEEIKERSDDEIVRAITFYSHAIVDEHTTPLLRLMARKQRNVLLAELDRREPS